MKKSYLFPNRFKKIGWIIAIPSLVILLLHFFQIVSLDFSFKFIGIDEAFFDEESCPKFEVVKADFLNTILPIIIIIGLLFIAFSKEKTEDEMIMQIREKSFVWAVMANSVILIIGILFTYGFSYLYLLGGAVYLVLILFITKFYYELRRLKKSLSHEE